MTRSLPPEKKTPKKSTGTRPPSSLPPFPAGDARSGKAGARGGGTPRVSPPRRRDGPRRRPTAAGGRPRRHARRRRRAGRLPRLGGPGGRGGGRLRGGADLRGPPPRRGGPPVVHGAAAAALRPVRDGAAPEQPPVRGLRGLAGQVRRPRAVPRAGGGRAGGGERLVDGRVDPDGGGVPDVFPARTGDDRVEQLHAAPAGRGRHVWPRPGARRPCHLLDLAGVRRQVPAVHDGVPAPVAVGERPRLGHAWRLVLSLAGRRLLPAVCLAEQAEPAELHGVVASAGRIHHRRPAPRQPRLLSPAGVPAELPISVSAGAAGAPPYSALGADLSTSSNARPRARSCSSPWWSRAWTASCRVATRSR